LAKTSRWRSLIVADLGLPCSGVSAACGKANVGDVVVDMVDGVYDCDRKTPGMHCAPTDCVATVIGASKRCYLAWPAMRDVKAGEEKRFTSTIEGHLVVDKVC
jgi:hypothetical protein